MSERLSSRATATLDYEHTAPEAAQADPTSALALGTHIGSQRGHHKTHLNQRTLGQCKGYGQSLTYLDQNQCGQSSRKLGVTAELGVTHKAFSRLLEIVTIMLQLKLP